ncbi:substrate-binding periplasmic protein [Spirochaeta cellobiosiphila]|uniref:substrate-binding periplasmic protein n=1 Tax=Spirochaeta cellobiosiphila TaxID=504483 RepID=UPI0004242CDA|nr:transporter substrate-binding domain-containing protein [Spirochaeta cellobiosiphila]
MKKILFLVYLFVTGMGTLIAQSSINLSSIESQTNALSEIILEEAYTKLGIELTFTILPPERALASSNSGATDGEVHRIKGTEKSYPNLVMVPVPINSVEGLAITKNLDLTITGWESIRPYKIGIRRGIKYIENGTKGMDVEFNTTDEALLQKLIADRIQVAVESRLDIISILKSPKYSQLQILEPPLQSIKLYHFLNKKHSSLIPQITKVLEEMEKSGRIKEITDNYISSL